MLKRIAILSAAAATATVLSLPAMASNGGVVGNVVNAGENIVNDVVGAGENVVDDIADAVTGRNDGMRSDRINRSAAGTDAGTSDGAGAGGSVTGTTGTAEGGTATAPDEVPDSTDKNDSATQNPSTGISFAYGTLAALALGGAGMMMTFRRDD